MRNEYTAVVQKDGSKWIGWIQEMIEIAGGLSTDEHLIDAVDTARRTIQDADLRKRDPEIILLAWCGLKGKINPKILEAREGFLLVISYNPGYQTVLKDLKHSTRQRFVALEFDYPPPALEQEIVRRESGVPDECAARLAQLGGKVRNLREHGLQEGVSTRLLIYAGKLIEVGVAPRLACGAAVVQALTDDVEVKQSLQEVVDAIFPER